MRPRPYEGKTTCLFAILWTWVLALAPASAAPGEPPAGVLDLAKWKLMLPVSTVRPDRAGEIQQPELNFFADPKWFFVTESGRPRGVVFRAHCGGSTSKGSKYPRSELREMSQEGRSAAAWATDDDKSHTMTMRAAVTATPPVKNHVVCAQIHDSSEDVLMIRLEGRRLLIERGSQPDVVLDSGYTLGTPFALKIEAGQGRIGVWYNDVQKLDWKVSRVGCYFKAGCYTQSNVSKGDAPESYGEVVIYDLKVDNQ